MKSEQARQENKHKKQWDELLFRNETSLRELEQLQVYSLLFISKNSYRESTGSGFVLGSLV